MTKFKRPESVALASSVDFLYCQILDAPLHGLYLAAKQSVQKTECCKDMRCGWPDTPPPAPKISGWLLIHSRSPYITLDSSCVRSGLLSSMLAGPGLQQEGGMCEGWKVAVLPAAASPGL